MNYTHLLKYVVKGIENLGYSKRIENVVKEIIEKGAIPDRHDFKRLLFSHPSIFLYFCDTCPKPTHLFKIDFLLDFCWHFRPYLHYPYSDKTFRIITKDIDIRTECQCGNVLFFLYARWQNTPYPGVKQEIMQYIKAFKAAGLQPQKNKNGNSLDIFSSHRSDPEAKIYWTWYNRDKKYRWQLVDFTNTFI